MIKSLQKERYGIQENSWKHTFAKDSLSYATEELSSRIQNDSVEETLDLVVLKSQPLTNKLIQFAVWFGMIDVLLSSW